MLLAVTISGLLVAGLMGVVNTATETGDAVRSRNDLTRQARFAMTAMVRAVSQSRLLLLPLRDQSSTPLLENIREQTEPPSAPPTGSTLATAVLAVTLPGAFDFDGDGVADADNDADGLIDEDLPADTSNDGKPGLRDIDDDGNGNKDFWLSSDDDDDESNDLARNEDPLTGGDDDADDNVDEDPGADNNGDGCAGLCGVDDDGDGSTDEGTVEDDDEDGNSDEDWYDPLVFYLENGILKQRQPVPWDTNADSSLDGRDYVVSELAANVTRFRVERLASSPNGIQLVAITLELTHPDSGASISLQTRVRVGGAL